MAALFVEPGGVYAGLPDVDAWTVERDARMYAGPHPVVAHPPCERWGRYAGANRGSDDGCFKAAIEAVWKWGGVLEHPEGSHAWPWAGLRKPPRNGGWILDYKGGWTCCVEQGHYGHRARKATWLYAVTPSPPELEWGRAPFEQTRKMREATTADEIRRARKTGVVQNLSRKQRRATPIAFRDLLLSIARSARPAQESAA